MIAANIVNRGTALPTQVCLRSVGAEPFRGIGTASPARSETHFTQATPEIVDARVATFSMDD